VSARDDVAAYLLGELDAPEHAAFERAAAGDPELRAEIERLRPVVQRLHELDNAVWAPAAAPALAFSEPPHRRERRTIRLRPLVAGLAAALLLAAGIGIGLVTDRRAGDAAGGRSLALAPVGARRGAHGEATLRRATATIDVSDLPPTARGQFYELWLLNSADDLISLGSFRVPASGSTRVTVPLPPGAGRYRFVDLSVEPDDGNPAHSGDSVLRGRVPGA
jgi:anti-sigma-K factor RskA